MEVKLRITEEEFMNDKGEKIQYFSCVARIAGTDIRFVPKAEDKSLLKYLLSSPKEGK